MNKLRVYLFGTGQITADETSAAISLQPSAKLLLAFLLLHRQRSHHRDTLASLFWGDQPEHRARRCLSTALWRLRSVIGDSATAIHSARDEVRCSSSAWCWLDVAAFEDQAQRGLAQPASQLTPADAAALEQAVHLYRGDLLEGHFDDWVLRERERLLALYLRCLAQLMRYHQHRGEFDQSLLYGQRILAIDPLREEIHREVMRLYLQNQQRSLALQQGEMCRRILDQELGIEPMEETQLLYQHIIAVDHLPPQPAAPAPPAQLQHALQQLNVALHMLDNARQQLQQAVAMTGHEG